MASVYDLKPRFQALLRPAVARLRAIGITPNGVTLLALAGSVAVGAVVAIGTIVRGAGPQAIWLLLLPAWLFLRMALNAIDGMMAREHDLATPLGAILNELGDVLSDVALYLPLAFLHAPSRWLVVAFVLGAVMTEFCGVLAQALGGGRQYQGPMGKSDRAFWIGALATQALPALLYISFVS